MPFRAAAFAWDRRLLWVVGSELTESPADDYRWEELRGGRYVGLDPSDGQIVVAGALPDEVAWGNGGVAVVMAGDRLCVVGRTGRLHWLADPDRAVPPPAPPLPSRRSASPTRPPSVTASSTDSTAAGTVCTCRA